MKKIKELFLVMKRVEEYLGIVLLVGMVTTVVLQIFFRYIVGKPLIWTEELARFLFVWLIMLLIGYCVGTKSHVRVEVFVDLLPGKVQLVIDVIMKLLSLAFFLYLIPHAFQLAVAQHKILSTALQMPYSYIYGAVALGSVSVSLHILYSLASMLFDKDGAS